MGNAAGPGSRGGPGSSGSSGTSASQPGIRFGCIAVIGLGLIGGSVAAAARRSKCIGTVCGFAAGNDAADALALGLIDEAADSLAGAVTKADMVVLATPVTQMPALFAELADLLKPGALITDCGSTKGSVIAAARAQLGDAFARFVPGHPISGSEFSGPRAARADLFDRKLWLLAPVAQAQRDAAPSVQGFVESLGAICETIDATTHDALFAEYSHAPHALVYAICQAVADGPNAARLAEFAGAGFRDTTRIGASSPALWTDILLDNRAHIVDAMDRYLDSMQVMRDALAVGDHAKVLALISRASIWRAGLDTPAKGK